MSGSIRVSRNAIFNLAGGGVPAVVALLTIPIIVQGLGEVGYGLLTLITAIVGYFALLDINVTAGSVKHLSEFKAKGDDQRVNETVTFGLVTYLVIGLTGALLIYFCADLLVQGLLKIPQELQGTGKVCLQIAAIGFALGQLQTYLQSIPQALLRYDLTSRFEIAFGVAIPVGTVGLLMFDYGLVAIVTFRVVASAINCLLLWVTVRGLLPALRFSWPQTKLMRSLVEFSTFSFMSRMAAVTYAHADKLIIGAFVGIKELAYYTVAATLANRVLGLMFRVSAVLFPAASTLAAQGKVNELEILYVKASRYVGFLNGSILILIAAFAEPILRLWIGADFAVHGVLVLQLIAIAHFVDSLTNLPSLVNDGMGHPRVSGTFALVRAALGLALLFAMVKALGIEGAAWAHLGASFVGTTAFLIYVHGRTVPCSLRKLVIEGYGRPIGLLFVTAIGTAYGVNLSGGGLIGRAAVMVGAVVLLSVGGYLLVLLPTEREQLRRQIRTIFSKSS